MGYTLDVPAVAAKVLEEPSLRHAIDDERNSLDDAYVKLRLQDRVEAIKSDLSTEISQFDAADTELLRNEQQVQRTVEGHWIERLFWPLLVLFALLAIAGVALFLFPSQTGLESIQKSIPSSDRPLLIAFLGTLFLTFVGVNTLWRSIQKPVFRARLSDQLQIEPLRSRNTAMRLALDKKVENAVRQEILQVINSANKNFYQSKLILSGAGAGNYIETSAQGLSETTGPGAEIPTAARRALIKQLETLPGASLGISGPRGVGKTTLLLSICKGNPTLRGREAIGTYTSAPIEYDGREFLLHLFSTLCRQVLKTHGIEKEPSIWAGEDDDATASAQQPFQAYVIRVLLVYVGIALTALGLFLAASKVSVAPSKEGFTEVVKVWSDGFGLQAGPAVFFGLTAIIVGILASVPRRFRRIDIPSLEEGLAGRAQSILQDLKFQRSFTSGWSGALKIPAGLELGTTRGLALAFRPESLPELVLRFRLFVQEIVSKYAGVVIAIDELDKLKSAEAAETFLNEVKSVFNIPGCFYLISISESALSAFQRRGLPFRDAFDSAFDDVLYIDYLTLSGSRALLARRVLNLPGPFVSVAHVISGGLPRELIRVTRSILEIASRRGPVTIQEVVSEILNDEVRNRCRAINIVARQYNNSTAASFLLEISELEADNFFSDSFQQKARLVDIVPAPDGDQPETAPLITLRRELRIYLSFLALASKVLLEMETEAKWLAAENHVEALARARQGMELGPGVAEARLATLRKKIEGAKRKPRSRAAPAARRERKPKMGLLSTSAKSTASASIDDG